MSYFPKAAQGRPDANQQAIMAAIREADGWVQAIPIGGGFPDLLVWYDYQLFLIEVKTPTGTLNAKQRKWHESFPGTVHIARSPTDALGIIGALPLDERCRRAGL